jgi:hypothetical protein
MPFEKLPWALDFRFIDVKNVSITLKDERSALATDPVATVVTHNCCGGGYKKKPGERKAP